jgi:hypothetical protein
MGSKMVIFTFKFDENLNKMAEMFRATRDCRDDLLFGVGNLHQLIFGFSWDTSLIV